MPSPAHVATWPTDVQELSGQGIGVVGHVEQPVLYESGHALPFSVHFSTGVLLCSSLRKAETVCSCLALCICQEQLPDACSRQARSSDTAISAFAILNV